MRKLAIASLVMTALGFTTLFAQTDNIGHTRHKMHHNPKHAVVVDESRFDTNRDGAELDLPAEEESFTFGVFGDRTGGPVDGVAILADAVHDINLFEPDLVMTVGDLVQGYNATPLWLKQMHEYKGIMDELRCPWFPVAGNHDIYWRGPNRPEGEHEKDYEMHFGPLWYAFEHKNCWFIALYSDEGNPKTGEKTFHKPASQRMSDEQFEWLKSVLKEAKDADHVFLFLHHPRWKGGNYGSDWDKVHQLLVDSGNVTAVFAGHIHRMEADSRDGIKYLTLATVGGGQGGYAPEAGWLHQYNLVTVRKDQIAVSSIPVGEVIDPLKITAQVSADTNTLSHVQLRFPKAVKFKEDHSVDQVITAVLENPTGKEVEARLVPESLDSRWAFSPDLIQQKIPAFGKLETKIAIKRQPGVIDETFRRPRVSFSMDYLAGGLRYAIPERSEMMRLNLKSMNLHSSTDLVLDLDGNGAVLRVPSKEIQIPDGPLTLEAWFEGDKFDGRTALVAKTQNSEYGFFVTDGQPSFTIHLGDKYVEARGKKGLLKAGHLYHIAGVYDGGSVRLYLDGKLLESKAGSGTRTTNDLDLMIGGDVDGDNRPTSTLDGRIHSVALSKSARYTGRSFTPSQEPAIDSDTVFASDMDTRLLNWVINDVDGESHGILNGNAHLIAAPVSRESE